MPVLPRTSARQQGPAEAVPDDRAGAGGNIVGLQGVGREKRDLQTQEVDDTDILTDILSLLQTGR